MIERIVQLKGSSMADENVLELASLPQRHPKLHLLHLFGAQAIIRLSMDPVLLRGADAVR